MSKLSDLPPLVRWRLLLGESAEGGLGEGGRLEGAAAGADAALGWLYGRDEALGDRDIADRQAGGGASSMTVPDWINAIHDLFPQETIERLERDAIEQFGIDEVITNPDVLARVEPNVTLLKAVLQTKHLMNQDVLRLARELVRKVVERLMKELATEVQAAFRGTLDRQRHAPLRFSKNFDALGTLKANLKNIDSQGRLIIRRPRFFARTKNHNARWQVILLVDQSGSMLGSTIHAAVTAACLWGLPAVKTHLCVFDTEVVDLTRDITDPVETLMKVQFGGGTDICKAVRYGAQLIDAPQRTIFVVLTDFFEGGDENLLVKTIGDLSAQGTKVLGLAALDSDAVPAYDRQLAQRLVNAGAFVGAMTPGQLAEFIAQAVNG